MKKIKSVLTNKKVVIILVVIVIAIGSSVAVYAATTNNKVTYEVIKNNFVFEYGDKVEITAEDVIKYNKKDLDPKFNLDLKKDSKSYVPVGKYTGSITFDKEKIKFDVTVKDTVVPEFTDKVESINLDRESQEDITSKFKATDLSGDVKITADDFDRNVPGTYDVTLTAVDASKNKTTTKVNVIVDAKSTAEKQAEAAAAAQAQAEAEEIAKQQANNGNSSNNGSSTNGGNSSPSNNSGGTTPVAPTPPPATCTFTGWKMVSNSGYANHDLNTTTLWAEENWPIEFSGYKIYSTKDNCGRDGWTVGWYKGT